MDDKLRSEIKKLLGTEKLIIGSERTLKALRKKNLSKIIIASNCPEPIKKEIEYLTSVTNIELIPVEEKNEELGVICKKPFNVSVVGLIL